MSPLAVSSMKRPASRRLGKQKPHRCGCCGETSHRLEKCPLPGAAKLLKLTKMVSTMSSASSSSAKKVQRKEKKWRLASKSSGGFAARARKAYSKRTAERKPSPAEVQRRIDQSLPEPPTDVTSAIEWLLQNKFVRKPRKCSDCGGLNIKRVFDCEDRPPHWRCTGWTKCQCRISIYAESIFCGLRVDPLKLVAMLYWYLRRSQSECPKVASLVADLQIGRSVAEHFLAALRKVESQAGQAWCRKQKLNGNVECDATALVKFHVKKTNIHYKESIDRLVHALNSRKKKIPGSFVVHVSVLAAQSRDSSPVVYVPKPQVPREHA